MKKLFLLMLWLISSVLLPASAEDKLISPDEAFKLTISETYGGVDAYWEVTQGYYLYQNKLELISETPGITVETLPFPEAETKQDPTFGEVKVYHESFTITAPLKRKGEARQPIELTVKAKYQGCADIGMCYPPITKTLKVNLGADTESATSESETTEPQTAPTTTQTQPQDTDTASTTPPETDTAKPKRINDASSNSPITSEQAFPFELIATDAHTLQAHWQVKSGHHLYRNKIKFVLGEDQKDIKLGTINFPKGEEINDEFFGRLEVYPNDLTITIPLEYVGTPKQVNLRTHYQGCSNESGICYPPQTLVNTVDLTTIPVNAKKPADTSPESTAKTATSTPSTGKSEAQEVTDLLESRNYWTILPGFFLMGLGLVLTPCIFPMIPILSGIIAGSNTHSSGKGFLLSLVYIMANATAYAFIGVMFGLFGENLQATLQHPAVISSFAALFVLLAFSMFGFYDLQMPTSIQSRLSEVSSRQQSGSIIGAAIMGFLSTLIVGPCTAPVLTGALTYIADSHDAILGGTALFTMGIAMGLPLLVVGTSAGHLLPKAGAWMDTTKAIFGIMMLGMAIYMLKRIVPYEITMALTSVLLITSGIYMGALDKLQEEISGWNRFWKSLGLIMFIYGLLILLGVAGGSQSLLQPLKGVFNGGTAISSLNTQTHLPFKLIRTVDDLEQALNQASTNKQSVMLDFTAEWCPSCKTMDENAFSSPDVIKALNTTVVLQADITKNDAVDQTLLKTLKVVAPPTILFFGPDGLESSEHRIAGYMSTDKFLKHVLKFQKATQQ